MKLIRPDEVFPVVKMLLDGVPVASPFRLSFDGAAEELLTNYRCADRAIPRKAGHF